MNETLETRLQIYGTAEPPEAVRRFEVGPLSFELRGGNLGHVSYGHTEVLRGIFYLVRDESWGTCPVQLGEIAVEQHFLPTGEERLDLSYRANAEHAGISLNWQARIEVTSNSIDFRVTAQPDADFRTNRTGFSVLHPIRGVAGKPLTVSHRDGRIMTTRFPERISPGQPFFDIQALEHRPAPGIRARVAFKGGKFEMEDQRNWGDASFKTYVGSLLDPWPYVLPANQEFTQSVSLSLEGAAPSAQPQTQDQSAVADHLPSYERPRIGLAITPEDAEPTLSNGKHLIALRPAFLTCYMDGSTDQAALRAYADLGKMTGLPITVELVLPARASADNEMGEAAQALQTAGLMPHTLVVTQAHDLKSWQPGATRPQGPSFEEMAKAARHFFPGLEIGGGMLSFFTELNRKRPPRNLFDFVTHSFCPIVHDAGDAAVMETLEALPDIFATARSFIGDTPYDLGPTTIAARMNPYGADLVPNPGNRRLCLSAKDPRQFATFAVDWNRGLIEAAARAGIRRLTLGGLCGPRGLLDEQMRPTPLYHFFKDLLAEP
jgi:hypothetical protein